MREKGKITVILMVLAITFTLGLKAEFKNAGLDENTIETVAKKVFASVVKVEARNGFTRVATGVVVDKDGYIVTTALISAKDEDIFVLTSDGKKSEAKFLGWDPETHVALIQAKEKNLVPISFGKVEDLSPGSWIGVVSISPENTPAVTQGIVNSMAPDKMRLNVWVTRGASGSPVVNNAGQMVALLRGIYAEDQPVVFEFREKEVVGSGYVFNRAEAPSSGMALAIPVQIVRTITAEIKEKGRVSRGWVGVSIAENEDGRVEIGEVEDKSPAELAKMKEGDILLEIDGKSVTSAPMFVSEIRAKKPGQDINLKVEREGKPVEVKVKLGEYPEDEAKRELELRYPRLFPPPPPREPVPPKPVTPPELPKLDKFFRVEPFWGKRKYVGVYLEAINKELLAYFGVKEENGLLVTRVTKDGPAEKAGLKVGDVIVRVDGKTVKDVSDLSGLVQDKKKGDKVKVELVRDKKTLSFEVEVAEEESRDLSGIIENFPEYWADVNSRLSREYDQSRRQYEKYSVESRAKLKKLQEEMTEQGKKYSEDAGKLAEQSLKKSKETAKKYYRYAWSKDRRSYRV